MSPRQAKADALSAGTKGAGSSGAAQAGEGADSRPDAELMARFAAGDDEAFRVLVRRHEPGLLQFFYRRCFDRTLAEDCVQEVFLRLVKHRGGWRPDAKFTTYLYRIAENHWIDRWRSRKSAPKEASLDDSAGEDGGAIEEVVPGAARSPLDGASDRELGEILRRALDALPEEQRAVFVLAETRGLRYQDIAEVLNVPVGTVKSRMHAATGKLREILESEGIEL